MIEQFVSQRHGLPGREAGLDGDYRIISADAEAIERSPLLTSLKLVLR